MDEARPVERVLVVSKTHLDVGFTDLAAAVRDRYLRDFFPRAVAVGRELRALGGPERLCWTTGSWILHEALEAADAAQRADLERAIADGDLAWHALPFTTHTELADRSLLEHGLSISARLDDRFGRTTRAAKLTDVPGHTRGLVSVLAAGGVDLLHVGVNPAAASPDVPARFRWRDDAAPGADGGAAPEVTVMYQAQGYGALQVLEDGTTAVVVEMTGDNLGPPSAEDVATTWALLRARMPEARLEAATLDDVADVLRPNAGELPVVTAEIGDTWIHGIASDPSKTAAFRETCRRRAAWIDQGRAAASDDALWRASTELLLVAEHTWGLDLKSHWPDTENWSEPALSSVRPRADTRRLEWSWTEQRAYLDRFMDVLERGGRSDLAAEARDGMLLTGPQPVSVEGLTPLHRGPDDGPVHVRLGTLTVSVDPHDGALIGARSAERVLADPAHALGRVGHRSYDGSDYRRWFETYNAGVAPEDRDWAWWDNTKPGIDTSGARSAWYAPDLVGVWAGRRPGADAEVLVVELSFPDEVRTTSAAPHWVLLEYSAPDGDGSRLDCTVQWVGKPAARWAESTWWSFNPVVDDPDRWTMTKLGEAVSPTDVVSRGARTLHAVDAVRHDSGVTLEVTDAPLVAPGRPALLSFTDELPDLTGGWHMCLYDNVWGTNFPMWCPGDARFRATLRW
jgi:Domain of unknown function (DUF5054)